MPPASDPILREPAGGIKPARHVEAIVTSDVADTGDMVTVSRAIYVGVGGDITVIMADGSTALHKAVPAGSVLPLQVKRVATTGTTASQLVSWT